MTSISVSLQQVLFGALLLLPAVGLAQTAATPAMIAAPPAPAATAPAAPVSSMAAPAAPSIDVTIYRYDQARTNSLDKRLQYPMSVAWQNTTTAADGNPSTPAIHSGVLFFGAGNSVYAVNASDGSIKWTYPSGTSTDKPGLFRCPPTVADGKVFIGNDDNHLYAIDEATGAGLWEVATKGPISASPLVDNGTVFFGSLDGGIYAVRESDQQSQWGGVFHTTGPVLTPVLIDSGFVYFVDNNNSIYCATEATGRLMWPYHADNAIGYAPIIAGNSMYVGEDRNVIALAARTGSVKWIVQLPAVVSASPTMQPDSNIMYVPTSDAGLSAVTTRGTLRWTVTLDTVVAGSIIITDNALLVGEKSGVIVALDPATGKQLWDFPLLGVTPPYSYTYTDKGILSAGIMTTGDAIYSLDNMGTLTALKTSAVDMLPPTATLQYPPLDKAVSGYEVAYKIQVSDAGSGIDPSSASLTVDGASIPVEYKSQDGVVQLQKTSVGQLFGQIDVKIPKIASGQHALEFKAADWRGNQIDKTWYFTVDSTLDPPNTDDTTAGTATKLGDSNTGQTPSNPAMQQAASSAIGSPQMPTFGAGGAYPSTAANPSSGKAPSAPSSGGGTSGSPTGFRPLPPPPTTTTGSAPVGFPPPPPV